MERIDYKLHKNNFRKNKLMLLKVKVLKSEFSTHFQLKLVSELDVFAKSFLKNKLGACL